MKLSNYIFSNINRYIIYLIAKAQMASKQQLTIGNEDPYKSEGHIEMRIENLTGFVQEQLYRERLSDPVYLLGVPWKICVISNERDEPTTQNGQTQRYLGFSLEYNGSTDPSRSYEAAAKLKILSQKKGSVDHVFKEVGHKFSGIAAVWKYLGDTTLEDLWDVDKGFYDEQSDSITLAMDLTVDLVAAADDEEVGEYVLIGQNEMTLDKVPMSFSMQIGNLQWQIDFDLDNQDKKQKKSLVLRCKDMEAKDRRAEKAMLVELFGYHRDGAKSETYSPIFDSRKPVHRHLFTRTDNSLTISIPGGCAFNNTLFTVRVLKERNQFPDFTKPTAAVGRFQADVKLRVGDQQFHVNRQMLSMFSAFFDRMFHGDYTAATQQEVELSLITHSAELFHNFLLVLCVNEALPNSINVAALFKLADFYDAENVRQKCDQHLRMAREMPIGERMLLACDHGSEETRAKIMNSVSLDQSKRINRLLVEHYCPKH